METVAARLGLDDLLMLKRNLTLDELTALAPRFALAAKTFCDSFSALDGHLTELRGRESLLTAEEAAQRLAVPVSFLRQAGRDGRIKVVNVGSYVRFSPAEIDRVKREGVREGIAPPEKVANLAARRSRSSKDAA